MPCGYKRRHDADPVIRFSHRRQTSGVCLTMARLTFVVVLAVSLVVLQQGAEANPRPGGPVNCISSCAGLPDGDYHSCSGCTVYASCTAAGTLVDNRPCAQSNGAPLVWDDVKKRCEYTSQTCGGIAPPNRCITSCAGLPYGDYQSCRGCNVYASCDAAGNIYDPRPCATTNLVWDDILKRCEYSSQTCGAGAAPVATTSAVPAVISGTGSRCIRSCAGLAYIDYQSCQGCNVYASCTAAGELIDNRPCAPSNGAPLVWDDNKKSCEYTSPTCSVQYVPTPPSVPSAGRGCISGCAGRADGDYQSCKSCNVYASCVAGTLIDERPCAPANPPLVWDDNKRSCDYSSPTCGAGATSAVHAAINSTGSSCIHSCAGLAYGDYQSCQGCNVYASCTAAGDLIEKRSCAPSNGAPLVWDDNKKSCEYTSPTCSVGGGSGGRSGGSSRCVNSCAGLAINDYQSCRGCNVYVSCGDGEIFYDNRPCPAGLVWDDNVKRCEWTSATCP